MALQFKAHWFVIASCLTMFVADPVYAQAPGGQAKPAAPAKPPPPPPPPPPPRIPTHHVCARPKALAEIGQLRWTYDRTGRLISLAEPGGVQMEFVFDKKAPPESVDKLPAPDKDRLRCPGDPRPAKVPPPPPPPASVQKLVAPAPQKKGELPEKVQLFRSDAVSFRDRDPQKTELITNLLASIADENNFMGPISPNALTVQAAKELYSRFGEKITRSLAYRIVVAPFNVQEKFVAGQTTTQWKRFPLVADQWVRASGVGTTDTTPTVILTLTVYEQVKASVDAQTAGAKSLADAKRDYEKAYAGLPSWLEAIKPYFAAQAAPPQNNAATASVAAPEPETDE